MCARIVQAADGAAAKLWRIVESRFSGSCGRIRRSLRADPPLDDHGELNAGSGMAQAALLFSR
jgi:hypothetical protein